MKIDGGIGFDPGGIAEAARLAEVSGYDGVWTAETSHDPFLPIAVGAGATTTLEFGTGIAVAFARNPMNLAVLANDLQLLTKGRFMLGLGSQIKPHITKRFSMPWSHPAPRMRELIAAIRAIWARLSPPGESPSAPRMLAARAITWTSTARLTSFGPLAAMAFKAGPGFAVPDSSVCSPGFCCAMLSIVPQFGTPCFK